MTTEPRRASARYSLLGGDGAVGREGEAEAMVGDDGLTVGRVSVSYLDVDVLDAHGASFVVHDFPGLVSPRWVTGRLAYVRFHGASGKYLGSYGEAALREWADWMAAESWAELKANHTRVPDRL